MVKVRRRTRSQGHAPTEYNLRASTRIPETPRTLIRRNPFFNFAGDYSLAQNPSPVTKKNNPKSPKTPKTPKTSSKNRKKTVKRLVKKKKNQMTAGIQSIANSVPLKELTSNIGKARNSIRKKNRNKKKNPLSLPKEVPPAIDFMDNIIVSASNQDRNPGDPRPIIIDGCNVAYAYAEALSQPSSTFLWRGVQLCLEFFSRRSHDEIVVFVPLSKAKSGDRENQRIIDNMKRTGNIIFTPSRPATGNMLSYTSYDDRYIVQYATIHGGIIVSNDNFHDLKGESDAMDQTINYRVLKFNFVGKSTLMFPTDPLGKLGPSLKDFLRF